MEKAFLYDKLVEIEQIIGRYSNIANVEQISKDVSAVRDRLDDDWLYLGVVGTFSSGKSTFINSVIGKNILPTDAIQGTTVTASILKKSDVDDLEIKYWNGEKIKYSTNPSVFDEKYALDNTETVVEEPKSLWEKWIGFIKRLFGIGKKELKREKLKNLYRFIISTENQATDIEYVTLYVDEENIDYNIALVDTPGTESLNDRHGEVTQNAIDNICDALIIVIPYDEPVSQELVAYVKQNIENYACKCIFAVTKVELLSDQSELPDLLEWIRQKIIAQLEMEDPVVIPMPTLLHLVEVHQEVKTSLFDDMNMSDEVKRELLSLYESGMDRLYTVLSGKRDIFLRENINLIYSRITKALNQELRLLLEEKTQISEELKKQSVMDLQKYRRTALDEVQDFVDEIVLNEITNQMGISNGVSHFLQGAVDKINECQNSRNLISEIGNLDFEELFEAIQKIASNYEKDKDKEKKAYLEKIRKSFLREYSPCNPAANISSEKVFVNLQQVKSVIEQMEVTFEQLKQELDVEIKRERKGVLKKLKNFFNDPSHRQISMVRERVVCFFGQLEELLQDEWNAALVNFKLTYKSSLDSAVQKMINSNQERIESYILKNNSEIMNNKIAKENLLKDLKMINSKNI